MSQHRLKPVAYPSTEVDRRRAGDADLADEFRYTFRDVAAQNRLAELRREDEVVLQAIDRARGLAAILHDDRLGKPTKPRKPAKAFA